MKKRLKSVLIRYAIILAVGVAYLIWVLLTDLRIPCPVYEITGLSCPACGITRAIASLARFDFYTAFLYNPFIFLTSPIIFYIVIGSEVRYVRTGSTSSLPITCAAYLEIALALVWGVVRNI